MANRLITDDYNLRFYKSGKVTKIGITAFKQPPKETTAIRLSPDVKSKIEQLRLKKQQKVEARAAKRKKRLRNKQNRNSAATHELNRLRAEWEKIRYKETPANSQESNKQWKRYTTYIGSAKWKRKRLGIFKRDGCCQACRYEKYLQVHHLSYANICNERDEDLLTLCEFCHKELHIYERTAYCSMQKALEYVKEKYLNKPRAFAQDIAYCKDYQ